MVDDDHDLQELFKSFLKKIGFSRVVVGTAKDAILSLRKQKFDLMFLDLQLPDATGGSDCRSGARHVDCLTNKHQTPAAAGPTNLIK